MTAHWRAFAVGAVGVALAASVASASIEAAEDTHGGAGAAVAVLKDTPATANTLARPRAQNSAVLAEDPTDGRFVALAHRVDAPDFGCGLQVSGDGGRGWVPAEPVPELPEGAEKCYAPEIAFDREGTLFYLFIGLAGRGNSPMGVFLTTSDDHAQTFSEPRRVLGPGSYQVRMAVDPEMGDRGRLHLAWLRVASDAPLGGLPPPPNPIVAAFSDDGGETFSQPVQVSDPQRALSVAPALAVGGDHAVHVLYYDLRDDRRDYQGLEGDTWPGRWSLVSATSSDGGRRFRRGVVVDDRLKPPERVMLIYTMPPPALGVGSRGRLFAAWHDDRNGDWDVFLRRSSDGGRSWERTRRLNDDRVGNGRDQYLPRLSVAPSGRLDAVFLDRRGDSKNVRNHTYYTHSGDGGDEFAANVRLSSASSDSRHGQRYSIPSAEGKHDFGARLGLLSRDSAALAAWTDSRNALGRGIFAGATQDIFTTAVVFRPGTADLKAGALPPAGASGARSKDDEGPDWPLIAAGGGVVLLGGLAALILVRRKRGPGPRTEEAA